MYEGQKLQVVIYWPNGTKTVFTDIDNMYESSNFNYIASKETYHLDLNATTKYEEDIIHEKENG